MIIKWSRNNHIRDGWNLRLPNLMALFLSFTNEKTKVPRGKTLKLHSSFRGETNLKIKLPDSKFSGTQK